MKSNYAPIYRNYWPLADLYVVPDEAGKTRYRKPRFLNRKKEKGWLAPSVQNKVDMHAKVIKKVHKILPVTNITIEVAQFDIQ